MRAIDVAIQVAPTDLSVLITGESGVGKESFPQIIHQYSRRKHGQYIAVNCGAIPEGTIDSELFGHEKGAFTGAIGERKGYFGEAGVEIDLIVRGICCLVPNQPYSANIRVTRIVDMFLEHSRVWYFLNDGQEDLFLTSADWMRRNLNRRIETAFPILDPDLKREIIDILNIQLSDNVKACYLDGELRNNFKCDDNPVKVRSQLAIYDYLRNKSIR